MAGAPNIKSVKSLHARTLAVTWRGGAESLVDVGDVIRRFSVFAPLRTDESAFASVRVGEWGWNAHWTDEMEISSDALHELALAQGSAWLKAWRDRHRMTQAQAASALGVSPRMWRYYEAGRHLLPKTVRLACAGFDAEARAA